MAWLALPLLFLLPGYLVLAAWRRSRDLDFWESLFLVPFTSILLSSWLGLVLAEIGLFSLVTLSILLLLFVLVLLILARRRLCLDCFARPSLNLTSLLLLIILALAGWAFSRPAEVISGTFDPGIYLSTGANIAHTGSIAYSDPFLAQLGDNLRPFLLERRGEIGVGAVRLPAFWMPQAQGDTVIPAFLHLYPVWLAILYSLGGIQAALFVSPIFGLMGVWALFLLGRRLAGTRVALLAAALLALNPAQIWFARYPISEVTVQMLLLGGLTLWVLMEERRSRLLALLGGASLGLAHLAKVDQVFLPVALFLTLFLIWVFKGLERRHLFFLVTYGVLLAQAILHVYFFSFAYTWINLNPFLSFLTSRLAIAFYLGGVLALIAAALARSRLAILREWLTVHRGATSIGLAGVVGFLAVYGYFFWPLSSDPAQSAFLSSDG
ncbi:MAG: glycosyltransferase family 39 protein, partial [Dehalococcoidia bacterium]|nr:glycosyltransferase family 39 protein [Dehalococcoidia bacterium]